VPCRALVGGDARSVSIAAASILAKVHRDALLEEFDRRFPGYGLARHKGYATRDHLDALRRQGPTPLHRRSFAPVRETLAILTAAEQSPLPF
jgi:ribonuclease HII